MKKLIQKALTQKSARNATMLTALALVVVVGSPWN